MRRPNYFAARVDEQGRITLPNGAADQLGLMPGAEISVVVGRPADGTQEYWRQVAEFEFPEHFQSRLKELLARNTEGQLSAEESEILDHLIHQVEWQTAERAKALGELQKLASSAHAHAETSAA